MITRSATPISNENIEEYLCTKYSCSKCKKEYEEPVINFVCKINIYNFCSLTCFRTHRASKVIFLSLIFDNAIDKLSNLNQIDKNNNSPIQS